MTAFDLSEGRALSAPVTQCGYKVTSSAEFGRDWPVADFGADHHRFDTLDAKGNPHTVILCMDGVPGSHTTGCGAGAEADLVAWLLTNREELLRLAAIGQATETNTAATAAGTSTP